MIPRYILPLLLLSVAAQAQITITQNDFQNSFVIGHTFTLDTARSGQTVDIGTAGSSAQMFDFSMLTLDPSSYSGTMINAAGTPFADSFPGATLAMMATVPTFGSVYTYQRVSSTEVLDYGSAIAGFGVTRNSPPQPTMKFPATHNTAWQYQSDSVSYAGIPGAKSLTQVSSVFDAFGMLMLPGGVSADCLRLNILTTHQTIIPTAPGFPPMIQSTKTVSFVFYLQNGTSVTVNADTNHLGGGSIALDPNHRFSYMHAGSGSGVAEGDNLPRGLTMASNHPNPFRAQTTVEYALANRAAVQIELVDMTGRILSTVYSGSQDAGAHGVMLNAALLPAGRYDCRITVNGGVGHHAVVVVK